MAEASALKLKRRGTIDVVMVLLGGLLMMGPSYISYLAVRRLHVEISIAAGASLVLFLVGAFVLIRVLKQ